MGLKQKKRKEKKKGKKIIEQKTEQEREKEVKTLGEKVQNIGLGTSSVMESFTTIMKAYVSKGEPWSGKFYFKEHRKYLHLILTNRKGKYCSIRISDNP